MSAWLAFGIGVVFGMASWPIVRFLMALAHTDLSK